MALQPPAFNDAKTYGFEWLRLLLDVAPVQAGVLEDGDHKITAAAAGGMRVDHAAGLAVIKATTGVRNGKAIVVNDANVANAVTLANSHATLPRIDLIYLRWRDSSDLGDAADDVILDKVTGTPTAGVTLDAPGVSPGALPPNSLLLAIILVPAASTQVTAGNVRDRRPSARGAHRVIKRTTNAAGTSHYTFTSATMTQVDAVNVQPRIESSGAPIDIDIVGVAEVASGATFLLTPTIDGATVEAAGVAQGIIRVGAGPSIDTPVPSLRCTPTPGSHRVGIGAWAVSGTTFLLVGASSVLYFIYRENLRAMIDNGT